MATLLPPPKRQKIYHGNTAPEPEIFEPTSNVVVQFVSEEDGSPLAPAVQIPANVSREGLEALVNKLSNQVRIIFSVNSSFHEYISELIYRLSQMILYRSRSMSGFLKTKTLYREHLPK